MTSRELTLVVPEYPNVLARAAREGWLRPLIHAHLTECTRVTAEGLLHELSDLPADLGLRWRPRTRGRARYHKLQRRYGITLPTEPAPSSSRLRIGLVLHEAAHVYDHLTTKRFGHGPTFCRELRELLATHWNDSWRERCTIAMSVSNFREIYDRHRGPYWLLLTRETPTKKGVEHSTDRIEGPLSAEEAHEEARILVNDAKDNVVDAMVFSSTEGQFTGAIYRRGETYRPWHEEESRARRVEPSDQRDEAALLPGGPEPLREVVDPVERGLPAATVPRRRPVRDVPAKDPALQRAAGPRGNRPALELDPGNAERWPKSEGAGIVRATLEAIGRATAADLAQRIAADCAKVGVAFPASLISRLKQGGFLREAAGD